MRSMRSSKARVSTISSRARISRAASSCGAQGPCAVCSSTLRAQIEREARLGFGLGGVINSYSVLPDVTALYLEGNFSLNYEIVDNLALGAALDVTNFAYEVPELGYSNMVNYFTYSVGLTWFIDVIPEDIRRVKICRMETVCQLRYRDGHRRRARGGASVSPPSNSSSLVAISGPGPARASSR